MSRSQEELNNLKREFGNIKNEIELDKMEIEENESELERLCNQILSHFNQIYPEITMDIKEDYFIENFLNKDYSKTSDFFNIIDDRLLNKKSILEEYLLQVEKKGKIHTEQVKVKTEEQKSYGEEEKLKYFLESGMFEVLEDLNRKKVEELDWEKVKNVYKDLKSKFQDTFHIKPKKFPEKDEFFIKKSELDDYSKGYIWDKEEIPENLEEEDIIVFSVIEKGWKAEGETLVSARLKYMGWEKDYKKEKVLTKETLYDTKPVIYNDYSIEEIIKPVTEDLPEYSPVSEENKWLNINAKTMKKLSKDKIINEEKLKFIKAIRDRMYAKKELTQLLKGMNFLDNEIEFVLRYANQ